MKLLIFLTLFSICVKAESFKIAGETIKFENRVGMLVAKCENQCLALKKIDQFKSIDLKKNRAHEQFIGSIGSDVCQFIYKANSILGVASNRDQRAFCLFQDGSMVEINSLSLYLEKKKIVSP